MSPAPAPSVDASPFVGRCSEFARSGRRPTSSAQAFPSCDLPLDTPRRVGYYTLMATETTPRNLTLTTPSGLSVFLRVGEYCGTAGVSYAEIPARGIKGIAMCFGPDAQTLPGGIRITHSFRINVPGGRPIPVGLAGDQALQVEAAIRELQAEIDAQPERQAQRLRAERSRVSLDLHAALAAAEDTRARAWERGDEQGGVTVNRYDLDAERARGALDTFDAEHPEIIAAIRAERALTADQILGM